MHLRFRSVPSVTGLLAHQGGWDEILMLVAPVAVIVGVLAVVKRRVDRAGERTPDGAPDEPAHRP